MLSGSVTRCILQPINDRTDNRAPVAPAARLHGLDALRGIALLGILLANVRQMFMPWDLADLPVAVHLSQTAAWFDWLFFQTLIDLKFLTLFSLLFGIGFALQGERIGARGHGFAGIYLRRVLILALLGLMHGVLLYPAEVLLPYALTALLLLSVNRLSVRRLIEFGTVLAGTMLIWHYQIGAIGGLAIQPTAMAALGLLFAAIALRRAPVRWLIIAAVFIVIVVGSWMTWRHLQSPPGEGPAAEFAEARTQLTAMQGTDPSRWPDEYRVRKAGDFTQLLQLHAGQYLNILLYFAILLMWRTLAIFVFGAALFRSGALTRTDAAAPGALWSRVARIGLGIGLPLSLAAALLQAHELRSGADWRFPELLHELSALPLAAGIAGAVFVSHARAVFRWIWDRIEAAGRMALSNYIGQSVIMAALAESWGLGLYGELDGAVLTVLAVVVYFSLAVLSHGWLKRFRMGPLEWLWRCGTYWRWLPNR